MKCVAAGPHPVRLAQGRQNKGAKNGFIQLKTYMDNSFCNGICIHWGSKIPMPATLSCTLAWTAARKGPEVPLLIYSAEDIR